jgi:hypothetical protein
VNWWITGSYNGIVTMVWTAFKHNHVTREQVAEAMNKNLADMMEMARDIESLSSPSVGNG